MSDKFPAAMHHLDIVNARRQAKSGNWIGHGNYFVSFGGEVIGEFRCPLCEGSRWLLANGLAEPGDKIGSFRDGQLCLSGVVGVMAKLTVIENDRVGPKWGKWSPYPQDAISANSVIAETAN